MEETFFAFTRESSNQDDNEMNNLKVVVLGSLKLKQTTRFVGNHVAPSALRLVPETVGCASLLLDNDE